MKKTLKLNQINNQEDVVLIREGIAQHEGVVACEVNILNDEVLVVFDEKSVSIDDIINSVEVLGYSIA